MLSLKNNDRIQLNSVDDIKEAITCDLWSREQALQSAIPAGRSSTRSDLS